MSKIHEGRLVRIRPIEEPDLDSIDRWRRDAVALGGFNPPLLRSLLRDQKMFAEHQFLTDEYGMFAVETASDGRLVGKVGYSKDSPLHEHMARTISLIGEVSDRGHGYATEARMLLVNYLFLSTQLERVYSETDERNQPARRSLEKCGMRFEGVLRHLVWDLDQWTDMAVYAILREEWRASEDYAPYRDPFLRSWADRR